MFKGNTQYNQFVREFKEKIYSKNENLLFLCIGSNRVIGDCFGPLVGSYLQEKLNRNHNILIKGSMKYPLSLKTLKNEINLEKYKKYSIVAIDAAIINTTNVGEIFVSKKPIVLGEGVGKSYIKIGDFSIKGSVCNADRVVKQNIRKLYFVPKRRVMYLANMVASGVYDVVKKDKSYI